MAGGPLTAAFADQGSGAAREEGDTAMPVRSLPKGPTATPTPSVKVEEFQALREKTGRLEARTAEQGALLDTLAAQTKEINRLVDLQRLKLDGRGVQMEDLAKQVQGQADALVSMGSRLSESQKKLDQLSDDLSSFESDFKDKRDKLTGMADLVAALKRDLNDNSQEIVDLRQQLDQLQGKLAQPTPTQQYWDRVLHWEYLPATAVGVALISVFLALRR